MDTQEPLPGGSDLGELGVEHEDVDITFRYFGDTIRVNPQLSEFVLVEFMDQAAGLDQDDPRAVTMTKEFVRALVHEDDFDVFWAIARKHRQNSQDLQAMAVKIMEAVSGRPTGPPSGSANGRSATNGNSRADSSDPVLDRLAGRPDLQLAVVQARSVRPAG
jgi:hypothetical protein